MAVSGRVGEAWKFFFFKQKTAYEMRISDWSSDVCSSDLRDHVKPALGGNRSDLGHAARVGRAACHHHDVVWLQLRQRLGSAELCRIEQRHVAPQHAETVDRKSTRLNSSH